MPTTRHGGSMQMDVTELTVSPRRPAVVPVVTMATPLAKLRRA